MAKEGEKEAKVSYTPSHSPKATPPAPPLPPPPSFDPEKHERPASISDSEQSSFSITGDENQVRISKTRSSRVAGLSRTVSEVRDGIQNQRDLEFGEEGEEEQTTTTSQAMDPNIVGWDGPEDVENPKYWSDRKKWAAVLIVSIFTFLSSIASSMVAPGLGHIASDLDIKDSFQAALVLSIFVAAYALGPLVWGPLSELYGRVIVIQISNAWFTLFNLGCGLARTKSQMFACRFMAGIGGSAPMAIGGGVLTDLFFPEQRGRAMSIYSLMPLLGPAIGPIAGGWVAQETSWRWVFYSVTIACAVVQAFGLFLLQETYPPVLLHRKAKRLIKATGNPALRTEFDNPDRTLLQSLSNALTRPFRLLATQVVLQLLALYMMFLYGILYLVLSTFAGLWSNQYHESLGIAGLNYISLGVGFFFGAQVCAPLQDRIYAHLKKRYNTPGRPEFRVPMMIPGAVLVPVGLLIYSWTAEKHTHWIFPNIGTAIYAAGTIIEFQCLQGYAVDSYARYAASAVGSMTVLRSLAGFGFPLFAPEMYEKLGYGMGGTVLAIIAVVLGWPSPFLLWKYGEKVRARSKFTA